MCTYLLELSVVAAYASDLLKGLALFLVCMVCYKVCCEVQVVDPHLEALLNAVLP